MPRLRPIHFILVGTVVVILTACNGTSTERVAVTGAASTQAGPAAGAEEPATPSDTGV